MKKPVQQHGKAIFSYLKNQKATIFDLQETSSKQDEKAWSTQWGGNSFLSWIGTFNESQHTSKSKFNIQLSTVEIDSHGRYIIAKLQIEETIFFLVNIYAPNEHREQEQFIRT